MGCDGVARSVELRILKEELERVADVGGKNGKRESAGDWVEGGDEY